MKKIKQIVLTSLFSALIFIGTIIITIPIGTIGGYVNFGDTIIFVSSILFGPFIGCISASIGSSIADLFVAPQYAIFTFFIKGIEALICGFVYKKWKKNIVVATILSSIWMVSAYFVAEIILMDINAALITLIPNSIQCIVSIIIAEIIIKLLLKTKLINEE